MLAFLPSCLAPSANAMASGLRRPLFSRASLRARLACRAFSPIEKNSRAGRGWPLSSHWGAHVQNSIRLAPRLNGHDTKSTQSADIDLENLKYTPVLSQVVHGQVFALVFASRSSRISRSTAPSGFCSPWWLHAHTRALSESSLSTCTQHSQ